MPVVWERSGEAFYADVEVADGSRRYYLIVERLLQGGWDWSVWRQRDGWRSASSGTAVIIGFQCVITRQGASNSDLV